MRGFRVVGVSLIVAVVLGGSSAALAQPTTDVTRKAARRLGDEGLALFDMKNFAAALEKLNQADSLVSVPTLDLFAARCLVQLGRLVEAADRYLDVTRAKLDAAAPEAFVEAQIEATKERVALMPRLAALEIVIEGSGSDATVLLDGKVIPADQLKGKVPVDPGDHRVEAKRGSSNTTEEVSLKEGESRRVVLELAASATTPRAQPTDIPAVDRGKTQRTIGWIGIIVGGAGALVWGATGAAALAAEGGLSDDGCVDDRCPAGVDTGTYSRLRVASAIGFWPGVVGLGAGTLLLLTAPTPSPAAPPARAGARRRFADVEPWIGPGSAGLRGTF